MTNEAKLCLLSGLPYDDSDGDDAVLGRVPDSRVAGAVAAANLAVARSRAARLTAERDAAVLRFLSAAAAGIVALATIVLVVASHWLRVVPILLLGLFAAAQSPTMSIATATNSTGFTAAGTYNVQVAQWTSLSPINTSNIGQGQNPTAQANITGAQTRSFYILTPYSNGDWSALLALDGFCTLSGSTQAIHGAYIAAEVSVTPGANGVGQIMPSFILQDVPSGSSPSTSTVTLTIDEIDSNGWAINSILSETRTAEDTTDYVHHETFATTATMQNGVTSRFRFVVTVNAVASGDATPVNWPAGRWSCYAELRYRDGSDWDVSHTFNSASPALAGGHGILPIGSSTSWIWQGSLDCSLNPNSNFTAWLFVNTSTATTNLSTGHTFLVNPTGAATTFLTWQSLFGLQCTGDVVASMTLPATVPPPGSAVYSQILYLHTSTNLSQSFCSPLIRMN